MNLETLQWDDELLGYFGIPRNVLPDIKSSSEKYALTDPHGPLGSAVPIAGILGDQHAAMVGQVCFERGESKTTYGTGNFALLNTGIEIVRSKNGLLSTVCYKFGDQPLQHVDHQGFQRLGQQNQVAHGDQSVHIFQKKI